MITRNKKKVGDRFESRDIRLDNIMYTQTNIHSGSCEVLERLFVVTDINKFINILEDELFFESVRMQAAKRLFDMINLGKLTQDDFKEEYLNSAEDGLGAFYAMLRG